MNQLGWPTGLALLGLAGDAWPRPARAAERTLAEASSRVLAPLWPETSLPFQHLRRWRHQ